MGIGRRTGDRSIVLCHSFGAKPTAKTPPPVVEIAQVEQKDVPVYGDWIGTLAGQVMPTSKRR
jgi:hypothetical protein